ncbi:MAG: hypothetical protein RSD23_03105 [Ruthenibacterium sp.]
MTTADWKEAEVLATSCFNVAHLLVDGYQIDLQMQRVNNYKNKIMVYINREFKGEWLREDCEERRRFYYKYERPIMSRKGIQEFNGLSKKAQKDFQKYRDQKYTTYSPLFPSFTALKRHFAAQNTNIELLTKWEKI